ncbi:hypothetical protein QCA50_010718 [Cerrena zonata]|uniref:CFA20 domain-containing protein n=1 Tax=Cerrena zonata TaxID=2478898 RepID=A0AAW0FY89_9APHY
MFKHIVQPDLVSIFSSTGSDPLGIFSSRTDVSLPSDSFCCCLNDSTSTPHPDAPATLIVAPVLRRQDDAEEEGYKLTQSVLHIQSPTLQTTFIQSPPLGSQKELGFKHPWIHIQARNMGREWSFEVGVVDSTGQEGIIRCSTFQKEPNLKLTNPPLLHLPLSFPPSSSYTLTSWCTIDLNFPSLISQFNSGSLTHNNEADASTTEVPSNTFRLPNGQYSHVSYVRIYATCRLRRIWFSESGPSEALPWEFQLFTGEHQ